MTNKVSMEARKQVGMMLEQNLRAHILGHNYHERGERGEREGDKGERGREILVEFL